MKFEQPMYSDGIGKAKQTTFRGLNHNPGAGDGQIYEMRNMCSDYYPLLATRPKRKKYQELTKGNGIFAANKLCWVDGTKFYIDGTEVMGTLEDSRKSFAAMNDNVIILPDKKYIHTTDNVPVPKNLEAEFNLNEGNGTILYATLPAGQYQPTSEDTVKFLHDIPISTAVDVIVKVPGINWSQITGFLTGNHVIVQAPADSGWNGVRIRVTKINGDELGGFMTNKSRDFEEREIAGNLVLFKAEAVATVTYSGSTATCTGLGFNSKFSVGNYVQVTAQDHANYSGRYKVSAVTADSITFEDADFSSSGSGGSSGGSSGTITIPTGEGTSSPSMGGNSTALADVFAKRNTGKMEFIDGTLYGESAEANTIRIKGADLRLKFHAGDAIEIYDGYNSNVNTKTLVVREVEAEELHFYENSFRTGIYYSGGQIDRMYLRRNVPDLTFIFECENRLWGSDGKTIYASKLGDPTNWYVYDGLETDSWTLDVGGFGDITTGCCYQGYPTFMRDGDLYKIFGSMPSNFELIRVAETGCVAGSERSLAVAGETLFYHNHNGVCAYAGGMPSLINQAFGTERYRNAVAGSDGVKYYVSMQDNQDVWHLFVYDTQKGQWHEEDNTQVDSFAFYDGNLYYADSDENIMLTGNLKFSPECEEEPNFDWYAEFTDFTDDSPNKKDFKRLQIRLELDEDTEDPPWVKAKLMMDSDGEWIDPEGGTVEDPEKRSYLMTIIPRRADHYRLRLEGHGGCRIYSIAREFSEGSDLKSVKGRQ